MMRNLATLLVLAAVAGRLPAAEPTAKRYDLREFGAVADGQSLVTAALQQAIDRAAQGGGTVVVPQGIWITGAIVLKSGVTLELQAGAVLRSSRNRDDIVLPAAADAPGGKPVPAPALIVAEDAQHVAIRGPGTIDGSGAAFKDKNQRRPKGLMLTRCRDVLIEGVHLQASGSWMCHLRDCDNVVIRKITLFNHVSYNNDGIDVDGCRNVTITGSTVDSDDDAVVLKSRSRTPCERVVVSDCTISSHCNALKMGTESGGGFRNIRFEKCRVTSPQKSQVIYGKQRGLGGVALEIVDGGTMDAISVSDITIDGVTTPIFLRLGNRARIYGGGKEKPGVGTLRNVVIERVKATHCSPIGCAIAGLPGHPVENVVLRDIDLSFDGGGTLENTTRVIPERPEAYPECKMFGDLPAYGIYARHVRSLVLERLTLRTAEPDLRHAVMFDDAQQVVLTGLSAAQSAGGSPLVRVLDSRRVVLNKPAASGSPGVLASIGGKETAAVAVSGVAPTAVKIDAEVPADAVQVAGP